MLPPPLNAVISRRQLIANAADCDRRNFIIRVDMVNADRTVAFCSIVQRNTGVLRRNYTHSELVWRAEQALAPLNGLGLLPMITVHMHGRAPFSGAVGNTRPPLSWYFRVLQWLGYPLPHEKATSMTSDPFGLQNAEHRADLELSIP